MRKLGIFSSDKEITYALEVSLVFFRISHNIPIWYDCVGIVFCDLGFLGFHCISVPGFCSA